MKILTLFILASCSLISSNVDENRELQSSIVSKISQKQPDFAKCAKDNRIFTHFKKNRVRVELHLSIDRKGRIESFGLDEQDYPESFSECIFKITDLMVFQKSNSAPIEIIQPFIFSKR